MSILVDALQPHIARGFFELRGAATTTLDVLIGTGFYPSFDSNRDIWELDFRSPESAPQFLAHECARFACASFQTYYDVDDALQEANRLPWALVKAYYAAFYAGHSILRALGLSCTYIDGGRAAKLREVVQSYGIAIPFVGGLYSTSITESGTAIRFENIGQGHGGTHEAFWRMFHRRLHRVEEDVLTGTLPLVDAQNVNVALGRLRAILTNRQKDGSWLSSVRNEVQYRQAMGVWYPGCRVDSRDMAVLRGIARGWLGDPLVVDLDGKRAGILSDFLGGCAFLVALCRALLDRIGERGTLGRRQSFAHFGPLRYLRTRKVRGTLAN
jgi:hypothetical protein